MEIVYKSPSEIKPFQKNPKKHPEKQISMLKKSMETFGYTQPILINSDNMIIAGHARHQAAQEIGLTEVPTILIDLPYEKAVAYVLADNRLAELAEDDEELMRELLAEVVEIPDFDIESIGFDDSEIDELLNSVDGYGEIDQTEGDCQGDLETRCKYGDIWSMGTHRIICGDSSDDQTKIKLMNGETGKEIGGDNDLDLSGKYDAGKPDYNVVMYSGGKDSLAMLLCLINDGVKIDEVTCCDFGEWDWPELKSHHAKVEKALGVKIKYIDVYPQLVEGFEKYGFPQLFARWCNTIKVKTLKKYISELENKYNVIQYMGIAYDERERLFAKHYDSQLYKFPLVTKKITEADALQMCYDGGFDFEGLYNAQNRLSCWCCPLTRDGYILDILQNRPELWERLRDMQSKSKTPFKLPGKTIYHFEHLYWCRYTQEGIKKDIDLGYREQKASPAIIAKIEEYLEKATERGDIIISIDSNTDEIVIACERTGRVCYGLERDPQYCDVILKRWEKLTGLEAIRR